MEPPFPAQSFGGGAPRLHCAVGLLRRHSRNSREEVTEIGGEKKEKRNPSHCRRGARDPPPRDPGRALRGVGGSRNCQPWGKHGLEAAGRGADGGGQKFAVCRGRAARSGGRVGQRRWVTSSASLASNAAARAG